jgi:glycosyltransferase involved in cell wall biosynthesis
MDDKPPLSILVAWCARDELRFTLAANAPLFRAHHAEILVLNCAGDSPHLRRLIAESEVRGVRQLDIPAPRFNKSLALNVGLAHARSDTVFVLDADLIILNQIPLEALHANSFITIDWLFESAYLNRIQPASSEPNPPVLQFTFKKGAKVTYQLSHGDRFGNRRSIPGLLLAKKDDLIEIHGYNSELQGWGWEDDDVVVRLQYVLGRRRIEAGSVLHLTHGDDRRMLNGLSRGQSDQRNFIQCCRNYNNGHFLGTYAADIAGLSGKLCEIVVTPGR